MGEMKSAWERAIEKVEKLGKLTEEELKQIEYRPAGNKLAATYLADKNFDLGAELNKSKGSGSRKYIIQGIQEILLRNISLARDEQSKKNAARAMDGLRVLKENKKQLEAVFDRIANLLNYYEQALQQTYAQFKQNFESKLRESAQALRQQQGQGAPIEAQIQAQFQAEWHRVSSQLDAQYEKALEEHRQQIAQIA